MNVNLLKDRVIHALLDSEHADHALYLVAGDRCEELGYLHCAQVCRWLWGGAILLHKLRSRWWQITTWGTGGDYLNRYGACPPWLADVPRKYHPQSWRRCLLLLLDLAARQDLGEAYEPWETPLYRGIEPTPSASDLARTARELGERDQYDWESEGMDR